VRTAIALLAGNQSKARSSQSFTSMSCSALMSPGMRFTVEYLKFSVLSCQRAWLRCGSWT
jgi:hypothetical protein